MSKNDNNDRTLAEDYLAHLQWHSLHRRSRPEWASNEPRWKFKIKYTKAKGSSIVPRIILVGIVVALGGYLLYQIIAFHSGWAIFLGVIFLLTLIILYFAIRDAEVHTNTDPVDFDSEQKQN